MIDDDEYSYHRLEDEENARRCAELIANEFISVEPYTRTSPISYEKLFDEVVWPTTKEFYPEGLSYFVQHRRTGEVVAALTANDLYYAWKKHPYDASSAPACMPLFDIADELDHLFITEDFGRELKPQMVLHIWLGATKLQHSGKGIATRLRRLVCDNARDNKGFQYAFVQVSNPTTRHIYVNKMHGRIMREIDTKTWIWKKQGDGKSCPYKDFNDGIPIPNILIQLKDEEQKA